MKFENTNTSQIKDLHEIYNQIFDNKQDGTFVEIGAYDGWRWSNSLSLINNGWSGAMVEPVPKFFDKCLDRYKDNNKIKVYNCCVGWDNIPNKKVYYGGPCTTILESMVDLFKITDPTDGHNLERYTTTSMFTLDTFLEQNNTPKNFEVLMIDVEGAEWKILEVFPIDKWKPKMAIIEAMELHPRLETRLAGNFEKINKLFINNGYKHIYGDEVNSIWILK